MTDRAPEGYLKDSKGRLVPEHLIRPADLLIDQTVRKIAGFAEDLSAQIARFKGHTYEDIATTLDLLAERYGARLGGGRGNLSLTSFDGTIRVQVAVHDRLAFGPELQVAKSLIYRCIEKWSDGHLTLSCELTPPSPMERVTFKSAYSAAGLTKLYGQLTA